MADKGIIFSAPMVRALHDGRKTQTRRLLSLRCYRGFSCFGPSDTDGFDWHFRRADKVWCDVSDDRLREMLPYAPGDRLYVREAWRVDAELDAVRANKLPTDTVVFPEADKRTCSDPLEILGVVGRLRPSMHQPRWASRLTLTVSDVRVQRVAEISEEDAFAEGVESNLWDMAPVARDYSVPEGWFVGWSMGVEPPNTSVDADQVNRQSFRTLWDSLHTKPGERWEDNPWIVAVSFECRRGNIDRIEA